MKITLQGKEAALNNAEVKSAKRIVARFMKQVETSAKSQQRPTYYFTVLLIMHIMAQDAIDSMGIENFTKVLNALNETGRN